MTFEEKFSNRHDIGPGGIKCVCCGPAPGKGRKMLRRRKRARMKTLLQRELREALVSVE